jgi:hypothetical protein
MNSTSFTPSLLPQEVHVYLAERQAGITTLPLDRNCAAAPLQLALLHHVLYVIVVP